jgi:hypothetical protein
MYITLTLLVDFYTHLLFGYNLQENPIILAFPPHICRDELNIRLLTNEEEEQVE